MAKSTLFEISTVKMPSLQTSISPCKSLGSSFSPSDHDTEETLGFGVSIPNLSLFFHNQLTFKKLFHFAVHCMWKQLMKPSGLSFMRRTHVSFLSSNDIGPIWHIGTMLENHLKCLICIFEFSTNFCPNKIDVW